MISNNLFSRERAAGYDPQKLSQLKVLLLGAGALGQNVAIPLASAGVGRLTIVDFDHFEVHNATRAPLMANEERRRRFDNLKACCVAHELAERTWWNHATLFEYGVGRFQEFGDSLFQAATVVISCVDDKASRADIAAGCVRHNVPMIEGGVEGSAGSFAVYSGRSGPCWQCGVPVPERSRVRVASCDMNALEQSRQGIVPMTQTLVAIVGGYMSEAAIQLAHGDRELCGKRVYIDDIRNPAVEVVVEPRSQNCPSPHNEPEHPELTLDIAAGEPLGYLLETLAEFIREPRIELRAPYVLRDHCAGPIDSPEQSCSNVVNVRLPEWALSRHPRCTHCGGTFEAAMGEGTAAYRDVSLCDEELLDSTCFEVGIAPSEWLSVVDCWGTRHIVALPSLSNLLVPVERHACDANLGEA